MINTFSMENNLEDSTLTIDLNSNPEQNPNEISCDELIEELSRVKSENKRLTDLLTTVSRNLSEFKHMQLEEEEELSRTKKRKAQDNENLQINLSNNTMPNVIRSNISRVYVRIDPSDVSLVVKDGYHWRKYGQKVTRDNPSPRAYYKCSFAPACPAKKKVQRSVDDPTLLVATYEGQHHHHLHPPTPTPADSSAVRSPSGGAPSPTSDNCSKTQSAISTSESNEISQFLVEKMASSLTRNSGFTTALAAAIREEYWTKLYRRSDKKNSNFRDFLD